MAHRSAEILEPLVVRLRATADISDAEVDTVRALPFTVRDVAAGWEMVREGDHPSQSCLMLTGVACRFKIIGEGARQILSVHIAGDLPDFQSLYLERMDNNLSTLTASRVALLPHRAIHALKETSPRLASLLMRGGLVDGAISREWLCNIGRRQGHARVAHFICEMFVRYRVIAANDEMSIPFAFKQAELGDMQGMSTVHVNRTLNALKREGLISTLGRVLTIHDWPRLKEAGDFNSGYLHLRDGDPAAA